MPPIRTTPLHLPAGIRAQLDRLISLTDFSAADIHTLILTHGYDIKPEGLRKYIARRRKTLGIVGRVGRPRLRSPRLEMIAKSALLALELAYPSTVVDGVVDHTTSRPRLAMSEDPWERASPA